MGDCHPGSGKMSHSSQASVTGRAISLLCRLTEAVGADPTLFAVNLSQSNRWPSFQEFREVLEVVGEY